MNLSAIFAKPIDRPIEGVIKADDEAGLRLEVEEYVLTNEIAKRLEAFLRAYLDYQTANGVWISGFFGSGKSHLLKMLALLLENREVEGTPALDLFLPKCGDNELLRGDLRRAVAIPSQSILFNIDQKADVISKAQVDALLAVFVKVFDEACGYYGKHGHIAQFERDLDARELYDTFKQQFHATAGMPWETGREQALLEAHNIAAAYAAVTGTAQADAVGILDKYRAQYKVSIEDFAEQVKAYIDRQGPDFRLNFFVDEAGQYIADNVKLMTNLQTIAESLATKCRGRAWVLVTAQEEMTTVIGEMDRGRSNDFSKIQDRFKIRMKLTSTDVDEVIRERLLQKNQQGRNAMSAIYAQQRNNFRTIFDFADGGMSYRTFRDEQDFTHSYPFIPYQFALFQSAMQSLSTHNAFEGRHSSVGERSMLGVFQQVAIQIGEQPVGGLATFDLMFEGIRTAIKSQVQGSVLTAEHHLDHPFAVRVLKALFLVKYVKEFKATARNLTVLMLDRFDADQIGLRKRVDEALNLLEQQTYIQRHGDEYEYLTDEEKDVEEEIKNTEVETAAVADELTALVFDHVLKQRKIRHAENGQDYAFTRKLDDRLLGREYELAIHVISPFHEHAENEATLRAQTMGRNELLVILPASERLMRDLIMYKRTEKYVRQNLSTAQQDSIKRILSDKGHQNNERLVGLRKLVEELLRRASLVVDGADVEANGSDPQSRIIGGFHDLIVRTYPNLRMLRGVTYTESDLTTCLQQVDGLLGNDDATFSEAEQEMLAFVQGNHRNGQRTTVKAVLDRFERKPYGWYLAAIQCTLAKLWSRGKLELRQDSNTLDEQGLARALRNTQSYANLVLEPQIEFTPGQVRKLREFHADFFDGPPQANEAKQLAQETAAIFQTLHTELVQLRARARDYPFLIALDVPLEGIQAVMGKPYAFYLTELPGCEADALHNQKEDVIDPIRRFMHGAQREIYDDARRFLQSQEANLVYAAQPEAEQIQELLAHPQCYNGSRMNQVKSLLDAAQAKVQTLAAQEKAAALEKIAERWERLTNTGEFGDLTREQQHALRQDFDVLEEAIDRQTLVAVMRDRIRRFDDVEYPALMRKMVAWARPAPQPDPGGANGATTIAEPRVEYVPYHTLRVPFDRPWLADEADVQEYLQALEAALLHAVRDGKRVQV